MYQGLLIVFTFEFCVLVTSQEQKQRTASLIVLPPLVLGDEELNEENSPKNNNNIKRSATENQQAHKPLVAKQKKVIEKEGEASINRDDVTFKREGHRLIFAGHFVLPHFEYDCPFHDTPDEKIETLYFSDNRSDQGSRNLHGHLSNILKNNLLKSFVSLQRKNVDDKGNKVVLNVASSGFKPRAKHEAEYKY